ncbi:MAG: hypothetical protein K1000chlam2_00048 [Chlamydiae bacterium]|nr:hypothetical protein [Chlamydiota bacterium]
MISFPMHMVNWGVRCDIAVKNSMETYGRQCKVSGDDVPVVEMNESGVCCVIFKGDFIDCTAIEDYLMKKIG